MSHSHSIAGMSAALQQQEYMERLRAAQLAERDERIRKKAQAKAFDYILNHDRDSGGNSRQESAKDEEQQAPGDEPEATEGFGKRYA
jgi:hypothetical protein